MTIDNALTTYPMSSAEINQLIDKINSISDIGDDGLPLGLTDLEKAQYENVVAPLQFFAAQIARSADEVFARIARDQLDENQAQPDSILRTETNINGRNLIRQGLMLNSRPEEVQNILAEALSADFDRLYLEANLTQRLTSIFGWNGTSPENQQYRDAGIGLDWALEMYDRYGARSNEDFRQLAVRQILRGG